MQPIDGGDAVDRRVNGAAAPAWWNIPRWAAIAVVAPYLKIAYRIRGWGSLPRPRGATVVISNHQHELDDMAIVCQLSLMGPWREPIFTAASRRLFEPGFLAWRIRWLEPFLRRWDLSPLFGILGMLPIENELYARPVTRFAWAVYKRHGNLELREVFETATIERQLDVDPSTRILETFSPRLFARAQRPVRMNEVHEPYRHETLEHARTEIERDLERLERHLRRGATLYLCPEGRQTTDGRMGRLRRALARLAPLARVMLAPVSYDPFLGRRLSMLYRVVPPARRDDLPSSLASARPVTVSQLLGRWLTQRSNDERFTLDEVVPFVERVIRNELPARLFVDPALRRAPRRVVAAALETMVRRRLLVRDADGRYARGAQRRDRRFKVVDDIVAFQARMLDETIAAARRLDAAEATASAAPDSDAADLA